MANSPRGRRERGGGAILLFCVLLLAVPAAAEKQIAPSVHSGIEERAARYLSVVRLRIEPTRNATIGQCQALGVEDLGVTIQGKTLSGGAMLNLDRKRPPTLHALVIDNSASMVDDLDYATFAAKEYVKQLRPDREKGLIMTFDENVVLMQAPTHDRQQLLDAIDLVRAGSRTSMLDALYYSMQELDAHRERPVLILLTDGADTSSMHGVEDIERQVLGRTDMTVFTIGLGLKTDQGVKPTRELMRDLAESTHGKYFEVTEGENLKKVFSEIRDILENEAILTVVDPDSQGRRHRIRVESRDRSCRVKILGFLGDEPAPTGSRKPIARPYLAPPQAYQAALHTAHFNALMRAGESSIDPGCSSGRYFSTAFARGQFHPKWFIHVGQRNASGCGPDVTLDHGRLYEPRGETLFEHNDTLRLTARPFEIPIPPFEELPTSPAEALDYLAARALELADAESPSETWTRDGEGHARPFQDYSNLVHGMTFLGMRGVLARAQFLYSDYRIWVMERLAEQAAAELEFLQRRYRELFPQQTEAAIALATRHSEDGQRIMAVAETPSEIDLQPYLSAWLGDISAHDLFLAWERRRIDRAIAGEDTEQLDRRFVEAWTELRRVFFAPSYARVVTMLVPVHDPGCDCVGFWRIVLPRPAWLPARVSGLTAGREISGDQLDLVPDLPAAWLTFERMVQETPGLLPYLREAGYRSDHLRYALLGDPSNHDPENAFASFGTELLLGETATAGEGTEPDVIVLRSELKRGKDAGDPALDFADLDIEATPTAMSMVMAEEVRQAGMRIFGQEEPEASESGPDVDLGWAQAKTAPEPTDRSARRELDMGGHPFETDEVEIFAGYRTPGSGDTDVPLVLQQRTSVVAVRVPVQVVRDGEPVRGLTSDNFVLMDRGKRRLITAVEVVDLLDPVPVAGAASETDIPPESRRHLVFIFDLSFSAPGPLVRAREAVAQIADSLHASDEVAVAIHTVDGGVELALNFTNDRDRILATLNQLREAVGQEGAADPLNVALEGPGSSPGGTGFSGTAEVHDSEVRAGMSSSQRRNERSRVYSLCQDFTGVAKWLAGVPGRKQVVYLSEGFDRSLVFGSEDSLAQRDMAESQESGRIWEIEGTARSGDSALQSAVDSMLGAFRRSDSVIQAIDISAAGSGESSASRSTSADGLHMLARGTGGELYRQRLLRPFLPAHRSRIGRRVPQAEGQAEGRPAWGQGRTSIRLRRTDARQVIQDRAALTGL